MLEGDEHAPRVVVTNTLASDVPARALERGLPRTEHRRHKRVNTRAENAHRPVRTRERVRQRCTSPNHAQRLLEPFSAVCNHFRPRRQRLAAKQYREICTHRLQQWREVVRLAPAA